MAPASEPSVQGEQSSAPLNLVKLTTLMEVTHGAPEIAIGLIDGPVAFGHPELASKGLREISRDLSRTCSQPARAACMHGTFVAGVLHAKRGSLAPAICPNCTLLVRPILAEASSTSDMEQIPGATPQEVAAAVLDVINSEARIINLSVAFSEPSLRGERQLEQALDHAAARGVIMVAAAGNQGMVGSSVITRHPSVIPVVAYDLQGQLMKSSNLGGSIGRRGLGAPGFQIASLGATGSPLTLSGTSVAVPFVTGAVALLWSEFPSASASAIKSAVTDGVVRRRNSIVPPLLDAWAAYQAMTTQNRRKAS